MIWKKIHPYILETTLIALMLFAILSSRYGSRGFINPAVEVFAIAFGFEGSSELKRRGRWKIRRFFFGFIITLFLSDLVLLLTSALPQGYLQVGFYSCFAVLAAIFPVAYYLSRNQRKTPPQPTVSNAS